MTKSKPPGRAICLDCVSGKWRSLLCPKHQAEHDVDAIMRKFGDRLSSPKQKKEKRK